MSCSSVSIDVRTEVSIDVGWKISSMEECLRSTVVSEYRSTILVSGSMVVDENRATKWGCCRSMRSVFLCGSNVLNLQNLMKTVVEFPCCF
ncbi:hypothetical protein DY000_02047969 [Brassica cretica]|uniref:Uncharacterized protein n=1 Tax=Brassica cretica TaxID=69181 RepID=A0ABQ7F1X7_BRACR|nr:hypothetical protein DY000_02047969 [Brassica cretica]